MRTLICVLAVILISAGSAFGQRQSRADMNGKLQELKTECEGVARTIKSSWAGNPKAAESLMEAESRYLRIRAKHDNLITVLQTGIRSGTFRSSASSASQLASDIQSMTTDLDKYYKEKQLEIGAQSYGLRPLIVAACTIINCRNIPGELKKLWNKMIEIREANARRLDIYKLQDWKDI